MKKWIGFTLSEVLITLGVIGVVAAMTLPTLIKNYQKQQTLEGLKVAYSIFSQAVEKSKQENGDISTWEKSYSNMAPTYILPYVENIGVINKHPIYTTLTNGIWFDVFSLIRGILAKPLKF